MLSLLAVALTVLPVPAATLPTPGPVEVRIRVVDGKNAPVAGADVLYGASRDEARSGGRREGVELDEWLELVGSHATSDTRGEVAIAVLEPMLVQVRLGDEFGTAVVTPATTSTLVVALEPDVSLRVQVVDAQGEPAVGVPVSFAQLEAAGFGLHEFGLPQTATTRGREAVATFPHLQLQMTEVRSSKGRVRINLPFEPAITADVDFTSAGRRPIGLALPPAGSVVVTSSASGTVVRLQRKGANASESFHRGGAIAVTEGEARFPFVGLGLDLEAEIVLPGVGTPIRTPFAGPRAAGETVHVPVTREGATVVLAGRVIDEDGVAIGDAPLSIDVSIACDNSISSSISSRGVSPRTDGDGRFRVEIPRATEAGCTRSVLVRRSWRDRPPTSRYSHETEPATTIQLPDVIAGEVLDVGEVRIVSPASKKRFAPTSDEELAQSVRRVRESGPGNELRLLDGLLCEIVRRGGKSWETFLEAELRRECPEHVEQYLWEFRRRDLEVLTALRRLQGKADPLALVLRPESVLDSALPESAVLVFDLKNVDTLGASFDVTEGGNYRSGRCERWRVEVRTLDGVRLPPIEWRAFMGGEVSMAHRLEPGQALTIAIPVEHHVFVRQPGTYEARAQYHDHDTIAGEEDLGGLICFESGWTRFEVREFHAVLTAAELAAIRGLIDSAPESDVVRLLTQTWRPDWILAPEETDLEAKLWSYGRKALLPLFEKLDDPAVTPLKRSWVFAQLYNLTGLLDPSKQSGTCATCKFTSIRIRDGVVQFQRTENYSSGRIDEAEQRAHAGRWAEVRASMRFEVKD